jgi:elongation factor Ts
MAITAEMVKQLREETGAGMLDCKKALEEFNGDIEKAKAHLAEKGLATAQKKADRTARDGKVETYTHPGGRVGVMVEVNCETDFVAKTEQFQNLAHDLALHIAFSAPEYVRPEDVPAEVLEARRKEFFEEAKASGKPENVIEKIVEGKLEKYYTEVCLLKQAFVKDDKMTINDLLIKAIAEVKENVQVSRFARFELGGTTDGSSGENE